MNMKLHRIASLTFALIFSLGTTQVLAQTQSDKAPAARADKAAALPSSDPGKRRGKGDRVMTKDELRACMSLKDRNDRSMAELDGRRTALDKERGALANAPDSSAALQAVVADKLKAAKEVDATYGVHAKAIQDWNARMAEFEKDGKNQRNAERVHQALVQEQVALKATEEKLLAERKEKITAYEAAVKEANDKIAQGGTRNSDWNKRNEQLALAEQELLDSRRKWASECGDRRFREDDEKAIKAGK